MIEAANKYMGMHAQDQVTGVKGTITQVIFSPSQNIRVTIQPEDTSGNAVKDSWSLDLTDSVVLTAGSIKQTPIANKDVFTIGSLVKHVFVSKYNRAMVEGACFFRNGCLSYEITNDEGQSIWVNENLIESLKERVKLRSTSKFLESGKATGGPDIRNVAQANKITS